MDDKEILAAALLWLRNHYDTDSNGKEAIKSVVVSRIDAVLADYEPTGAAMQKFRDLYSVGSKS